MLCLWSCKYHYKETEPYLLYSLCVYDGETDLIKIKIPFNIQFNYLAIQNRIKSELEKYPTVDIEVAISRFHEYFVRQNINRFDKVEEIEYKQFLKNQEPFIVLYESKPIKGIKLELVGKNPYYEWEEIK